MGSSDIMGTLLYTQLLQYSSVTLVKDGQQEEYIIVFRSKKKSLIIKNILAKYRQTFVRFDKFLLQSESACLLWS